MVVYDYHIVANLGKNRNVPGTLKVYDKTGKLVLKPVQALGRGTNHPLNDNDHTQQLKRNADTPSGVAKCRVIGAGGSVKSFGKHDRVHLYEGLEGNFLKAQQAGRSEILIHGGTNPTQGQPWSPLRPTHGCIRLSEVDMNKLIFVLNQCGQKGKITIN